MEQTLAENGMPAECMTEYYIYTMIRYGEYENKTAILQGTGTTMDMYEYLEGTPPQNSDEIAVTTLLAKSWVRNRRYRYLVLPDGRNGGVHHNRSVSGNGQSGHIRKGSYRLRYKLYRSKRLPGTQIKFTDDPDDKEVLSRIEKIKELYPKFSSVKTAGETVKDTTGVGDAIDAVKKCPPSLR